MSYLPPFATNLLAPLATLLVSKELITAVHYCYIEIITVLKGDAITADPTAIQFFIYHSNLPPNYAQLLKEQNKTKDDECQEYRLVCRQ